MNEIITDYLAGHTLEYLADKHGGSVATMWRWLKKAGVPLRKRGRPARVSAESVLTMLASGETQAETARRLKVSPSRVWRIVNESERLPRPPA